MLIKKFIGLKFTYDNIKILKIHKILDLKHNNEQDLI